MKSLKDTTCKYCKCKKISYLSQHCRKQSLLSSSQVNNNNNKINERSIQFERSIQLENELNPRLNEFIKRTQLNSECCDDFIEWVPKKNLENIKLFARGGNSEVYQGIWSNTSLNTIALKVIINSDNINESIINEFKMHHKCRSQNVIPFYGITKSPKGNDYAMVIGHAKHGDLRKYIREFFPKLTWIDKINILIEISKALNSLHQMNLVHRDFHCKNILVDKDDKIFISDFGLCQQINPNIVSKKIQGVLPYIAPEVLRSKPYTKQSEVYSISMIMWELTSNKPPFYDCHDHGQEFALSIINGLRPKIIEGTPDFYVNVMKQCWDSDPLKRPDSSLLPKKFEEMLESCKKDYNTVSLGLFSLALTPPVADLEESEYKTSREFKIEEKISKTNEEPAFEYTKVCIDWETTSDADKIVSDAAKSVADIEKCIIDSISQTAESVAELLRSRTTPEVAKDIVSTQKPDGSITLNKTVSTQIDLSPENIQSSVQNYGVSEKLQKVPRSVWETALSVRYLTFGSPQSQEQYKGQSDKAKEYLLKELKDEKLVEEVLKTSEKIIIDQSVQKENKNTEKPSDKGAVGSLISKFETTTKETPTDNKTVPKPVPTAPTDKTTPKSAPTAPKDKTTPTAPTDKTTPKSTPTAPKDKTVVHEQKFTSEQTTTAIKLSKDVEDAITCDDNNEREKAVALNTIKIFTTEEVVQDVVSKQNDDGFIEVSETVCRQLDEPSEEKVVSTVREYVTTEKLKNAKPSWITTAVNIAYLKNLADHHEGVWKKKYEVARQYLSKEIGNSEVENELINASKEYVVQKSTQRVIKDEKKAAIIALRSTIPEETVNNTLSSQDKNGSFKLSETITKELDNTSPKDLIVTTQSLVPSDKVKNLSPEKSKSIFETAITIAFLRTVLIDSPSNNLSEKYEKARVYLKAQIGDSELEEKIIKASSKVVIDKSSEKVAKESKKAALEEIQKSTTPETARAFVSKQNNDGSIEVSEEITDKLNSFSSSSLVTSVTTYTTNKKLKDISPTVWTTALSMQYLKNTASQYEGDWLDKYNKAREYIRSQVNDDNLVKEILETSDRYVLDSVTCKIVKRRQQDTLHVRKLIYDEETKKASDLYWNQGFNVDNVRSICSSQKSDGSFTLHDSIKKQLNITNIDTSITTIKSYISDQNLRTYNNSVFETALTIYILKYILIEHKDESNTVCERSVSWLEKQLVGNKDLEKELFKACEQYLVDKYLTIVTQEEVRQIKLEISEENRQTLFKYLQSHAIIDDVNVICTSQKSDGSFPLHSSIIEHLQLSSVDESVKGITRYTGIRRLKDCDELIYQTTFVIKYLEIVLIEYEDTWRSAHEKASKWLSKQLNDDELKEVYSASEQYLIEKGVYVYNDPATEVSIKVLEADPKTVTIIHNELKSKAKVENARSICKNQSKNGSFTLHKIISDQLKISSSEEAVDSLKSYVGHLRLRRLSKELWITAFIVTYFKIVYVEHESEWRTSYDRASSWISQQVHNAELENDLYSACEQYLIQQGCEYFNSKITTRISSRSVNFGSDSQTISEAVLNSELIVVGAAARAKCKVKLESAQNKTLEDINEATNLAFKYAEDEVNRLFTNNETGEIKKEDVIKRTQRATKFLMEEYYACEQYLIQQGCEYLNSKNADVTKRTSRSSKDEDSQETTSDKIEQSNQDDEIEDSRYVTQTYNFSLDDLQLAS